MRDAGTASVLSAGMMMTDEHEHAGAANEPPVETTHVGVAKVQPTGLNATGVASVPPGATLNAGVGAENVGMGGASAGASTVAQQCFDGEAAQLNAARSEVGRIPEVNLHPPVDARNAPVDQANSGVFERARHDQSMPVDPRNTGGRSNHTGGQAAAAVEACRARYEEQMAMRDGKIAYQSAELRRMKDNLEKHLRSRLTAEGREAKLREELVAMATSVEDSVRAEQLAEGRAAALERRLAEMERAHPSIFSGPTIMRGPQQFEQPHQTVRNPVVNTTEQERPAEQSPVTEEVNQSSEDMDVDMSSSTEEVETAEPQPEVNWKLLSESHARENELLRANIKLERETKELMRRLLEKEPQAQQPVGTSTPVNNEDSEKQAMKHQLQVLLKGHSEFTGERPNADKVEDFLHDVQNYQERAQLSDQNLIFHFQSMLRKTALRWWEQEMKPILPTLPVDAEGNRYQAVVDRFTKQYLPAFYKVEQRNKFHELKLEGGNLLGFIEKFRAAIFRLPDMPEAERWHALYGKISEPMRNILHIQGITLEQGDTMKALAVLHSHAKGLQQDQKKERTVAVHSAKRHYDSIHAPRDRPRKRERPGQDKRLTPEARERIEKIVVTKSNYLDWKTIPFMTRNMRTFLRENNGCHYCRLINKPADHTEEVCARQRRSSKKKDF
jgi:hypothetical protein